jgi:PAS domain S-box-containing protein
LERTTQLVQESLRAEVASLWLIDDRELVLTASSGPGARLMTGFRLPDDSGIVGYVAQTGEPFYSPDVLVDVERAASLLGNSDFPHGSILCVPVKVKEKTIGVVQAYHQRLHRFDQNDFRLLYSVASSVGIAIENARLFGEVQAFSRQLERKVAERTRELAEEKDKTEAILASMADGLVVLDANKHILTANAVAERLLGFRLSELLGRSIDLNRLKNPLWRCISQVVEGSEVAASASVDVPDPSQVGGTLSLQALAARVRDESDEVIGTVIVLRDITTIKEMQQIKARFMAGVTHELKTPLSIIRLHANNLQRYHARLPEQKRYELLEGIENQTHLLEQLVEDILALSRLDAGEARGKRETVDLSEVADEVVRDLRSLARGKQIFLRWDRPPCDLLILADRGQIKRLVQNLLDNAIKYTPAGGSVRVHLAIEAGGWIKLQVDDTGIGVPAEHQTRIFDRFFRVDPSHTIPGTGLGLSIVNEIVAAYGGKIDVESTPSVGSTFTVILPAAERLAIEPVAAAHRSD